VPTIIANPASIKAPTTDHGLSLLAALRDAVRLTAAGRDMSAVARQAEAAAETKRQEQLDLVECLARVRAYADATILQSTALHLAPPYTTHTEARQAVATREARLRAQPRCKTNAGTLLRDLDASNGADDRIKQQEALLSVRRSSHTMLGHVCTALWAACSPSDQARILLTHTDELALGWRLVQANQRTSNGKRKAEHSQQ
jgi:hypothetical protein